MTVSEFIKKYALAPEEIDGPACLRDLLLQMERGLAGEGNIPMIPSYLSLEIRPATGKPCCVMDAGGTNLRAAQAVFSEDGTCKLSRLSKTAMPGTQGELSFDAFYKALAAYACGTEAAEQVGLCFSYNVMLERDLDGILDSWCKEVRVPEAPGKPVGSSLQTAIGADCRSVRVLNDSTAALLGGRIADPEVSVGLIMGTGINICYSEACSRIPKVPSDLRSDSMIISTEIGEFDGFPKTVFDTQVIETSGEPALAHAEKQCAGAYLGDLISLAWQAAVREQLLDKPFDKVWSLPEISDYLAEKTTAIPENPVAKEIARTMLHRAAKIAAVLTAGPILRSCPAGKSMAMIIEGSQFQKLTGFGARFQKELDALLAPHRIGWRVVQQENSCLLGAALAAFAEPM